ncbi:MAG: UDP-N-acetylmuramoyl-L-alanine--D-glutamate ligase [Gammaproteobacteria bacterium]|nr:MAG: UDP-N-acetylmuramoyl-L-alanine--D-glutamate ligase [Gammaproteobacteria bacterium]
MNETRSYDIANLIVGLGATGLSCARFLSSRNESCVVIDRGQPNAERMAQCQALGVEVHVNTWSEAWFDRAAKIWLSPGTPLDDPAVSPHRARVTSDIEAFLANVRVPVIGVTGSNGKSTVTAWLAHVLTGLGCKAQMAGNIGIPALDALALPAKVYVLELSSFQLERLERPALDVAIMLNVSEDHLDRYSDIEAYAAAKHVIFEGAGQVIFNADDSRTRPSRGAAISVGTSANAEWQIVADTSGGCVRFEGETVLQGRTIRLAGTHNLFNAGVVMAAAHAMGFTPAQIAAEMATFGGLPHRCRHVADIRGVQWYNDSKATNVGATLAAVEGLSARHEQIVLLAGGQGKGQDFAPLKTLQGKVRALIVFGEDAGRIRESVADSLAVESAADLEQAMLRARQVAEAGDAVLLSPACASFDQFSGYAERGKVFEARVLEWAREVCA